LELTVFRSVISISRPLTHDDLVDAVAYIDQLANIPYGIGDIEFDEPEILDAIAGY
jgi:hypothetical protein